jgi:hypothetical protein
VQQPVTDPILYVPPKCTPQVDSERYAQAGTGDSGGGSGAAAALSHDLMPPPRPGATPGRPKRALPRGRGNDDGVADQAARGGGMSPRAAGEDGGWFGNGGGGGLCGAFDPEFGFDQRGGGSRGNGAFVFDSSQTSRRGAGSGKRKKTSFVAAPISQGAIPGGAVAGSSGGLLGGSAVTTPNGSGTRAKGRLGGMRRRG